MRQAEISRNTLETQITVRLNLDGSGQSRLATGVPFLDHMLDQIARHGMLDLEVEAQGDLHIDAHHTVEDIAISIVAGFSNVGPPGSRLRINATWSCSVVTSPPPPDSIGQGFR